MARIRSLKPDFWLDRKLARLLSRDERMLYMGLWNQADEWGRAQGDPRVVRGQIFPYEDDLTLAVIEKMLRSLHAAGVVVMYEVDDDPYLFLPKLAEHQRLEPSKVASRFPAPPDPVSDQHTQIRADQSAPDDESSAPDDESSALLYGTGIRGHISCPVSDPDESHPGETQPTFADFYAAYPRREARRKAEQAWQSATRRATPETIMAGLVAFRFHPQRQFIPLPASWLNADRWADGPSPPDPDDVPNIHRPIPPWEM